MHVALAGTDLASKSTDRCPGQLAAAVHESVHDGSLSCCSGHLPKHGFEVCGLAHAIHGLGEAACAVLNDLRTAPRKRLAIANRVPAIRGRL